MQTSAEIRWFSQGELPRAIRECFFAGQVLAYENRVDRYLWFRNSDSVGVKIRGGGEGKDIFEIKARQGLAETMELPHGISGKTDGWIKWSYSEPALKAWTEALRADASGWVEVEKERWLRKFSLDHAALLEVPATERPIEGCSVELTRIAVNGQAWWSFGFEAFGQPDRVRDYLQTVASHFLKTKPPLLSFNDGNSDSYPGWLLNFQS